VWPTNARKLKVCTNLIDIEQFKIVLVLSTRWVASSHIQLFAITMRLLLSYCQETKNDSTQDKTQRCTYEGLQKKMMTTNFILDLGLMHDACQEFSHLSFIFQEYHVDLYRVK
jgi:hypothetical protein